ncbi:hypothetical protein [Klebsiella pneumoniae]|uniref:hypothetical protein n=1 Tax=Klebsiella pneumoniae TaxID=573 RepID=UPI001E48F64C|nr:hypothetical protein [Klebsiella pneumoniae]
MKTSIKIAGFSYFIIINMVYEYGVSVTGGNIAPWAGKQPIKTLLPDIANSPSLIIGISAEIIS